MERELVKGLRRQVCVHVCVRACACACARARACVCVCVRVFCLSARAFSRFPPFWSLNEADSDRLTRTLRAARQPIAPAAEAAGGWPAQSPSGGGGLPPPPPPPPPIRWEVRVGTGSAGHLTGGVGGRHLYHQLPGSVPGGGAAASWLRRTHARARTHEAAHIRARVRTHTHTCTSTHTQLLIAEGEIQALRSDGRSAVAEVRTRARAHTHTHTHTPLRRRSVAISGRDHGDVIRGM